MLSLIHIFGHERFHLLRDGRDIARRDHVVGGNAIASGAAGRGKGLPSANAADASTTRGVVDEGLVGACIGPAVLAAHHKGAAVGELGEVALFHQSGGNGGQDRVLRDAGVILVIREEEEDLVRRMGNVAAKGPRELIGMLDRLAEATDSGSIVYGRPVDRRRARGIAAGGIVDARSRIDSSTLDPLRGKAVRIEDCVADELRGLAMKLQAARLDGEVH